MGLVFFQATSITQVFNSENNQALRIIASQGLKLYFLACPFAGFNIIISMYFTSVEHPLPAHMISLLRGFFVMIPTAFLLSWIGAMTGVWCAFPITEFMVSIIGVIFYLKLRRKEKNCVNYTVFNNYSNAIHTGAGISTVESVNTSSSVSSFNVMICKRLLP